MKVWFKEKIREERKRLSLSEIKKDNCEWNEINSLSLLQSFEGEEQMLLSSFLD